MTQILEIPIWLISLAGIILAFLLFLCLYIANQYRKKANNLRKKLFENTQKLNTSSAQTRKYARAVSKAVKMFSECSHCNAILEKAKEKHEKSKPTGNLD